MKDELGPKELIESFLEEVALELGGKSLVK